MLQIMCPLRVSWSRDSGMQLPFRFGCVGVQMSWSYGRIFQWLRLGVSSHPFFPTRVSLPLSLLFYFVLLFLYLCM